MSAPELNLSQFIHLSLEMDNYLQLQTEENDDKKIKNLFIRSFESKTDHFTTKQEKGWLARTWDRFTSLFSRKTVTPYSLEKNLKYLQERLRDMDTTYTLSEQDVQHLKEKFNGNVSDAIQTFVSNLEKIVQIKIPDKSISRKQALLIQVEEVKRLSTRLVERLKSNTSKPIVKFFQEDLKGIEASIRNTAADWKKIAQKPKMKEELYTKYLDKAERIRERLLKKSIEVLQKFQDAGLTKEDFEKSGLVETMSTISENIEQTLSSIRKFDQSKKEDIFLKKFDTTAKNYERDLRAAKSFTEAYKTAAEMIASLVAMRDLAGNREIFPTEKQRAQLNQKMNERVQKFNETFFKKCSDIVASINKELDGLGQDCQKATPQDLAKLYATVAQHALAIDGIQKTVEGECGKLVPKSSRTALQTHISLAQSRLHTAIEILNKKLLSKKSTATKAPQENIHIEGGTGEMHAYVGKVEQGAHVVINITKQAGMPGMPEIASMLTNVLGMKAAAPILSGIMGAQGIGTIAQALLQETVTPTPQISTAMKAAGCFMSYGPTALYQAYYLYQGGFGLAAALAGGGALAIAPVCITGAALYAIPNKYKEAIRPWVRTIADMVVLNYGAAAIGFLNRQFSAKAPIATQQPEKIEAPQEVLQQAEVPDIGAKPSGEGEAAVLKIAGAPFVEKPKSASTQPQKPNYTEEEIDRFIHMNSKALTAAASNDLNAYIASSTMDAMKMMLGPLAKAMLKPI
jgi:hypothetical protein